MDSWSLELPADRMLNVDARRLPVEEVDVGDGIEGGGEFDFRGSRVVGTTVLDRSYTSLRSGPEGWSRVRVTNQRGEGTELAVDDRSRWIHVYSADLSSGSRHRSALAGEPMTCPPDAFRSGRDLVTLEPPRSATAAWTISGLHGAGRERPGTPDRTAR